MSRSSIRTKSMAAGASYWWRPSACRTGASIKREIEDHGEAVCVLPYHPLRKTAVLVRQWRVPVLYASKQQQDLLEAVAGVIEDVDAATCAHREVMEEALLKLDSLEHVYSPPGRCPDYPPNTCISFSPPIRASRGRKCAAASTKTNLPSPSNSRLADLARMADENRLPDSKTLVLLQTLRLRRPELFL